MPGLACKSGKKCVDEGLKVKWPIITEEDKKAVMEVLDSGILWGLYAPQMRALEKELAEYVGVKHCLLMNSGTSALHAALAAVGLEPGDEVITPAFSFLASAVAVMHHNGIPVFVDVDPITYNIDANKIEDKVSDSTKAIIPVHMHGMPSDMDEINAIAEKHGLSVIEDACQSHGACYRGRKTGSLSDAAVFSLNTTKNLPGGEGGFLTTDSDEIMGKANMLRMFGEFVKPDEGRKYQAYTMGWNYRTQEMPCALTRSQLKRLDSYNKTAVENARLLNERLGKIKGVQPPVVLEDRENIWHKYRVRIRPDELGISEDPGVFRRKVQFALEAEGVDAVRWQTSSVPGQALFQMMEGYGKGCPWTCGFTGGKKYEYNVADYPETEKLIADSLVICSESHPIYCQPRELIIQYADAFEKVFENLDQIRKIDIQEEKEQIAGLNLKR